MIRLSCFLPLSTIIHFSSLSRFFKKAIDDPKSDYGRIFWKTWAIQTKQIRKFKGKTINFKFKLVKQRVSVLNETIDKYECKYRNGYNTCKLCYKPSCPDRFREYVFYNTSFCNCQLTNSYTIKQLTVIGIEKKKISLRKKMDKLKKNYKKAKEKMKELDNEIVKVNSLQSWKSMIPVVRTLKNHSRYKGTRTQSERLLKKVIEFEIKDKNYRRNLNFNSGKWSSEECGDSSDSDN